MSKNKKLIRTHFRESVFSRDNYKCVTCSNHATDAHHITDRNSIPNGGYVKENGISLCTICHIKAEMENPPIGFDSRTLYMLIDSSEKEAIGAAKRL